MSRYGRRYPEKRKEDDPFVEVKVYMPKSLHYILKAKSNEAHIPISKLICIALDNELDVPVPFLYPTELPASPYVQDAYIDEAGKIYDFLKKIPYGIARDHLLLCRRDMSVQTREVLLLAYRELLETDLIEEFYPEDASFRYPLNYRYTRRKDMNTPALRKEKYRNRKPIEVIDE
jgi:hypothetical protein